ncbi:MAG: carboxypeptidase regulatory-like domain-containing protein [Gemmatimonadota bacterium]
MLRAFSRLVGACSVLVVLATTADAQVFRGRVLDAESGAPVAGGIVKAIGAGGEVGAGTLTDAQGAFVLPPPTAFDVRTLSVERIGYTDQSFELAGLGDPAGLELLVDSSPVELGAIVITAESLCRLQPGSSGAVQTIWDEARKSLEVTAMTQSDRVLRYETESFQRDLRPSDYSVLQGSVDRQVTTAASPYRSISIEQMTQRGWVEGNPVGGMTLYAPDAAVLMTEEFASQHCFNAESSGDTLLLHFTPNRERRGLPELEGTLVLDAETAELTELRFRYVGMSELRRGGHAAGEIEFFAAPNGLRVVRHWAIRAPAMSRLRSGFGSLALDQLRVDYVHERGGRVLSVGTEAGTIELPVEPLALGPSESDRPEVGQVTSTRPLNRSGGAELLLRNNDPSPFQVTAVQLRNCRNTAVACGSYPVDVRIDPGETEVVFRLRQENVFDSFRFEWDYEGHKVEVAPAEI